MGLVKRRLNSSRVGMGASLSPLDASPVSKSACPASPGVSRRKQRLDHEEHRQEGRRREEDDVGARPRDHLLGEVEEPAVDGEREEDAARDHRAEDAREAPALGDVEPVRVDLDDAHRAEALEVHVERVEHAEHEAQRGRGAGARHEHVAQVEAHGEVGHQRAGARDEHALATADAVDERAVDHERERVDQRADAEDDAEVFVGHEPLGARQLVLGDREVVAPHVEQGVREPEGEPVEEAPHAELACVHDGFSARGARAHGHDARSIEEVAGGRPDA
jgi:hypothetical protein